MSRPYRIWQDVYQIGGSGISHPDDCSVYLVDADDLVMIDAGAGSSFDRLVDNIRSLSLSPEKLKMVIATHAHIDHVGALFQFRGRYGAEVVAHELDSPGIESGRGIGAEFYGVDYSPCPVDRMVSGAEASLSIGRHHFRLLHMPGHTPGSIAVYLDIAGKRVLFGQDIHGPYMSQWGAEPAKAKQSLRRLIELKADILCEGHFGVYQPAETVKNYIRQYMDSL